MKLAYHGEVLLYAWLTKRAPHTATDGTCINSEVWITCSIHWISWLGRQLISLTTLRLNCCWIRPCCLPLTSLELSLAPQRSLSLFTRDYKWCHQGMTHNHLTYFVFSSNRLDYTKWQLSCSCRLPCLLRSAIREATQRVSNVLMQLQHLHFSSR